ncbi:MAG: hypothetical protein ACI9IA_002075 [Enterobacterales bacterium]|jgi:hypothetical protein
MLDFYLLLLLYKFKNALNASMVRVKPQSFVQFIYEKLEKKKPLLEGMAHGYL